jgi:hypothetical protein
MEVSVSFVIALTYIFSIIFMRMDNRHDESDPILWACGTAAVAGGLWYVIINLWS